MPNASTSDPHAGSPDAGPTPLQVANVLLRRWRVVVGLPLLAGAIAVAASLLVPPTYTAVTSFVPESGGQGRVPGALAGLVGLGLQLGADASLSPQFYAEVIESRQLLERVALARYAVPGAGAADSATLLEAMDVPGATARERLARGVRRLSDRISARVDAATGIVRLRVDAAQPELAAEVANRFVAYLDDFNATRRRSQAGARRRFVEQRLEEAEAELRAAEERLRVFYQRNRAWRQAPQLMIEEGRLSRDVQIRQEVYLTLNREYETARIDEVNDTPVITVIDTAVPPERRSRPRIGLAALLGVVGGGMAGVAWAFGAAYFDRARRDEADEYGEFRELRGRVFGGLGRIVRRRGGRP